jgi:hypothetical protein
LVHSSIYIYTKAIHYLLKNNGEKERAKKSFEKAFDLANKKNGNGNHAY